MAEYIPINNLLNTLREIETPVACVAKENKNWGDWLLDVKQAQHFFSSREEKTWALYTDDTYEFLVLLFALWGANKIACVPGSNQPAVIDDIGKYVELFVGDFPNLADDATNEMSSDRLDKKCYAGLSDIKRSVSIDPLDISSDNKSALDTVLDINAIVLQVFTSGSSGEPELIPKSLSQLTEEIDNIHLLWESNGKEAVVFSTVSHHHIYGLLFRALWPLAEGNVFDNDLCEFFEDIERRATNIKKMVVISSPTHLSRIPQNSQWLEIKKSCQAVFSSGAPLPTVASVDAKKQFGFSPIEVFGSSETGGIAWRQQEKDRDVRWKPFQGIDVSIETNSRCLQIRSPYLPTQEEGEWYVTSDKVQFDQGSDEFQLLGRIDNIVKVEGKRVSISEMERKLKEHEWIEDARAVLLSGNRTEIGVVAVLSALGNGAFRHTTRFQFNKRIQAYLLNFFERPVLPRRWRFVEKLPFNTQGKVTQKSLLDLFSSGDGSGKSKSGENK
ncbi:MAG: AMP-binding protein [Cellvibrionaceae bacterium]